MDSIVTNDKISPISEENKDGSLPVLQINPLTLMTSISPFKPVDDNQENVLASTDVTRSQSQSTDVATLLSEKLDQLHIPKLHMDERSIAAWVKSTHIESIVSPIERSPSLPASIIEQISTHSRRNSTVSTLCDQQQQQASVLSDTVSSTISQNLSLTNDIQRSFSFPFVDQYQHDNNNEEIRRIQEENDDNFASQFLPAPESEDSEVDKKIKKLPSFEEPVRFDTRSPTEERSKHSPSISFHASVSLESHRRSILHRQRHNSWNTNKNKSLLNHRSQTHKFSTQSSLIHPKIIQKQIRTISSMPTGTYSYPGGRTNQSSSFSDNVFLSTSTTNSPSSSNHLQLINNAPMSSQFLSIPSSASLRSSNISDLSGQSGIESLNLRTSASEAIHTPSLNEEETLIDKKLFFLKQQQRPRSISTGSSRTLSTESLSTSSSEDEVNNFHKKLSTLNKAAKLPQTPADQRTDVLRQLICLLEKRPTRNPRLNLGRRKQALGTTSVNTNKFNSDVIYLFSSRFVHRFVSIILPHMLNQT
jgi:hypothetical protein